MAPSSPIPKSQARAGNVSPVPEGDLPPAPERPSPRPGASRRTGLTVETIVSTAIAAMDEAGIESLSMRQVAERLGTGVASLYGYVPSKEKLLELVFDELVGQVPLPEPDPARWREQVFEMLDGLRRALAAHRDAALAGIGRVPTSAKTLRAAEVLVATLRAGGLSDYAVAIGFDQLVLHVCAYALEESVFAHSGMGPEAVAAYYRDVHAFFKALPAGHFPVLVSIADTMTGPDGDERFAFAIKVMLSGLVSISSPSPEPSVV
jgi:AcrR family transcriptional regulator